MLYTNCFIYFSIWVKTRLETLVGSRQPFKEEDNIVNVSLKNLHRPHTPPNLLKKPTLPTTYKLHDDITLMPNTYLADKPKSP